MSDGTRVDREALRGVIVDEIGQRCGQIPDLHPRLLEAIESAADVLALIHNRTENGTVAPSEQFHGEAARAWIIGYQDGLEDGRSLPAPRPQGGPEALRLVMAWADLPELGLRDIDPQSEHGAARIGWNKAHAEVRALLAAAPAPTEAGAE